MPTIPSQRRAGVVVLVGAVAVLVGAVALLGVGLGSIDLWAPDEPRYAQVAEELRALDNGPVGLVVLHLAGQPYTQKPPLYYWLAAAAGALPGRVDEIAARLPSALAGVATVLLTLHLGGRLFRDPRAGPFAAALLLTVYRFAHSARRAQLDVLLALFETLALLACWRLDRGLGSKRTNVALLHGAMGLAILTKGPVGLLPLLVFAAYLAWDRRLHALRPALAGWAWGLSIGPALCWLAAATLLTPPGFFEEAVVDNVLGRFFTGTAHIRPFYYFAYQLPLDFLPWTLLWPLAVLVAAPRLALGSRRDAGAGDRDSARPWRFLVCWVGVMIAFFSLSAGKRGLYLLPAFPALALLCGAALAEAVAGRARIPRGLVRGLVASFVALGVAIGVVGAVIAVRGGVEPVPGFPVTRSFGLSLVAVAAATALGLAWLRRRAAPPAALAATGIAAVYAVLLALFTLGYPALDAEKSPRPIALAAARLTPPGETLGVFHHRALIGGIAYYAERPVRLLENADDARRFYEEGGRAIVVRSSFVEALEAASPLRVRARARHGERELLVVVPAGPLPAEGPG